MNNSTECPRCGHHFDLTESFKNRVEIELQSKLSQEREKIRFQANNELNRKLAEEKHRIRQQLENENLYQLSELQSELNRKSAQLQEFNKAKAEIEKLKREKDEVKSQIEAELQQKLTRQLQIEKEKLQIENENHNSMKLLEKDNLIQQLKENLIATKRQLEQGSTQLQGEVQEIAIENWLKNEFPLDEIQEVKKGQYGADTIQIIHERDRMNCGKIIYESKRTVNWNNEWISKFKGDIQRVSADVGILVTSVLPPDMKKAGMKEGVWVCHFNDFKLISKVMRNSIIKIDIATAHNKNRKEKMEILYDYILGSEFQNDLSALMDIFSSMKNQLAKEKTQIMNHWKKREKELDMIIQATSSIGGSIKAISGVSANILEEQQGQTLLNF